MEYFKKYRIASWIHRFRYAYGIKILFRPRRPTFPKSTRGILIPCMCVCVYLLNPCLHFPSTFSPENFRKIKFRIYRRYAYFGISGKSISLLLAQRDLRARGELKYSIFRQRISYSRSFFLLPISSESFEQLGQSNFTQLRGITFQFFLILER